MKRILVLYNKKAGSRKAQSLAEKFQKISDQQGVKEVYLKVLDSKVDVSTYPAFAKNKQIDTLVIIGGDGTIHRVVKLFLSDIKNYQIGLIPGGTVNNFARALGVPLTEEQAIATILNGQIKKVDFGKMGTEVVISSLTIGILADAAKKVTQKEKQKYGPLVFIKNFLRVLAQKKSYAISVQTPFEEWSGNVELLVVTMSNSVGGFTNFDSSAAVDDGLLHVTILPKKHWYSIFRNIFKVFAGKIYQLDNVKYLSVNELVIDAQKGIIMTRTDGDPTGKLPVKIRVMEKALKMIVPKD